MPVSCRRKPCPMYSASLVLLKPGPPANTGKGPEGSSTAYTQSLHVDYKKEPSLLPRGQAWFLEVTSRERPSTCAWALSHCSLSKASQAPPQKELVLQGGEGDHQELRQECKQRLSEPHLLGPQPPPKRPPAPSPPPLFPSPSISKDLPLLTLLPSPLGLRALSRGSLSLRSLWRPQHTQL